MKIAYVYDAVYPWKTGGVQKRVWELARRLAETHDVHWYGLHYWDGPRTTTREGVTLHGVGEPRELYVDGRRSIPEALSFSVNLFGPLRGQEFDVIDCQVFPYFSCYTSELSTLFDSTTLVFTWHEVWREYWSAYLGWKGIFGRLVERGTAALPGEHVAVSGRTKRELAALGRADCRTLPNGIDIEKIASLDPADESIDVLFVGRLIADKHPDLLVKAMNELHPKLPDLQCYIVGDGPEEAKIKSLITELELEDSVSLLEFRESHDEILSFMKAADVFVLPSTREGFGITILEALASGTPVVTTSHPNNAGTELVSSGETGFVVDRTESALAHGIRDAISDIHSDACRDAASDYDWDLIADEAEEIYETVCE